MHFLKKNDSPKSEVIPGGQKVTPWMLAGTVFVLALLWLFDLFLLRTPILTPLTAGGVALKPLSPMYAFWIPVVRPEAVWFLLAAMLCVLFTRFGADIIGVSPVVFAISLFILFCVLSGTLFLIREQLTSLGQNLMIYPEEEVYYDALRIESLSDFVRYYDRLQPQLSMRGQHYPPGGAVLLYLVTQAFGQGVWKVGVVVLLLAGAGVMLCYAAARQIVSEISARQAALLLIACPSLLDFSCTSMDAVFFFFASLCLLSTFLLGKRQESLPSVQWQSMALALLAGCLLYGACFFSFAAIPLGMCLALFLLINGRKHIGISLVLAALIATGFVVTHLTVQLFGGYSLVRNLQYAREHNFEFMSRVLKRPSSSVYLYACYGNFSGFMIGSGIVLTGAAVVSAWRSLARWTPWMIASALSLLIMVAGGVFLMETERIWLFAMPWMAVFAVSGGEFRPDSLRLLMACGLLQAALMEVLLFTLW
jgi:hypothetical protein